MKTITKSTLALEIIKDDNEIVDEILGMFDSSRCNDIYDTLRDLGEYIYGISIFIKDLEYIKSILERVCDRIPSVRDDSLLCGLNSKGYQEELKEFISNLENYICI